MGGGDHLRAGQAAVAHHPVKPHRHHGREEQKQTSVFGPKTPPLQIQQANTLALLLGSSLTALGLVIRRSAARNAQRRATRFHTLRRLRGDTYETKDVDD